MTTFNENDIVICTHNMGADFHLGGFYKVSIYTPSNHRLHFNTCDKGIPNAASANRFRHATNQEILLKAKLDKLISKNTDLYIKESINC